MKKRTATLTCLLIAGVLLMVETGCRKKVETPWQPQPIMDVDGNVYNTVTIGTQVWMVENLRTTRFNDGTSIPLVPDSTAWSNLSTPGFCWYNNDMQTYKNTYGALYNWFAVNHGNLCPAGWHIPASAEWDTLITYLGGSNIAGGKLKTIGTVELGTGLWYNPNEGATNESGFTAVPAGYRYNSGNFMNSLGHLGCLWSATEQSASYARGSNLYSAHAVAFITYNDKRFGFNVRCIKDH